MTATEIFPILKPIWCAGCGHFGVLSALDGAFDRLSIPKHETMVVAGIGCSGVIQNHIQSYGYHALHGRALPTATGAKLVNPELTVIAAGGDGDGLAIGAGHLVHTFRTNPSITYLLMNNATYGLTKGQPSPTSADGYKGNKTPGALDPILLGLSIPGAGFLARGYSGWPEQLERLTDAAIEFARAGRGFAFLEIISPCVAYNDSYQDWPARLHNVDEDPSYDPTNRAGAFEMAIGLEAEGGQPAGLIYQNESPSLESVLTSGAVALQDITPAVHMDKYRAVMDGFRG